MSDEWLQALEHFGVECRRRLSVRAALYTGARGQLITKPFMIAVIAATSAYHRPTSLIRSCPDRVHPAPAAFPPSPARALILRACPAGGAPLAA